MLNQRRIGHPIQNHRPSIRRNRRRDSCRLLHGHIGTTTGTTRRSWCILIIPIPVLLTQFTGTEPDNRDPQRLIQCIIQRLCGTWSRLRRAVQQFHRLHRSAVELRIDVRSTRQYRPFERYPRKETLGMRVRIGRRKATIASVDVAFGTASERSHRNIQLGSQIDAAFPRKGLDCLVCGQYNEVTGDVGSDLSTPAQPYSSHGAGRRPAPVRLTGHHQAGPHTPRDDQTSFGDR
mmetsp:Transcript_3904/g.5974  ORF Transcript_3904/g.5974 Transcript_3904/m.5974 type:complete len:234 (-) Transcript_3904:1079-1780(-)